MKKLSIYQVAHERFLVTPFNPAPVSASSRMIEGAVSKLRESKADDFISIRAGVVTPDNFLPDGGITIQNGKIISVYENHSDFPFDSDITLDTPLVALPGFIDLHIHGGFGMLFAEASSGDKSMISGFAAKLGSRGTTSFAATLASASAPLLVESAKSLQENVRYGSKLLGIHFEGPFVNPEKRGVLDERYLASPSIELADRLFFSSQPGLLKAIFTIAPEIPKAIDIAERLHEQGAIISAGHTDATYEQAKLAFSSGFTHVTHLFNAMRPLSARDPGIIGAALEDDEVSVEIIADGHHVSPSVIRMVMRAKSANGIAIVSDASPCAGLGDGEFWFGDRRFVVRDGVARMEEGGLAGSIEFQHRGLVLGVHEMGVPLVKMAKLLSETPARIIGRKDIGVLRPGASADIVLLDGISLDVVGTLIDGRLVESLGP